MARPIFGFGLLIALLSGSAALAHEMLWTRRLIDLLGGSSEANTRVLGLFFLGLSIGATLAQALLPRLRRPWLAAGIAELSVAVFALPALGLPGLTAWLWPLLGPELLVGWQGKMAKLAISSFVILPPAIAMGTTLPFFVTAILRLGGTLGREGIWVYAINTCGGVLGLIVAGGFLLPGTGAMGSMIFVVTLNAVLGILCFILDRVTFSTAVESDDSLARGRDVAIDESDDVKHPATGVSIGLAIAAAFASGVGLLAIEIIALQTVMLAVPLSFFAPLAVLACVVGLLAVAAPITVELCRIPGRDVRWWLPRSLAATGTVAILSPTVYMALVGRIGIDTAASVFGFTLKVSLLVLATFGPLFLLLGLTFPLAVAMFERAATKRQQHLWPILLAVNGIGGVLGAELAYRILMPLSGVHSAIALVGVGYVLLAAFVSSRLQGVEVPSPITLIGLALIGLGVTTNYVSRLPQMNPYLPFKILSERLGADGLVAVVEGEGPGRGILVANQYMLGSTAGQHGERRQAHLPLVLHAQPHRVGFIGLATGITPGAALRHDVVQDVWVAEISAGVVDAATRFFSDYNDGVTGDRRAKVVVEDGRTLVAASPDRFDVLVGDLFLPWGAGAGRLYSREHFSAARTALRSGGLFCQWLPMYQLTGEQFDAICATFQSVFPTVHIFRNGPDPMNPAVALVGFRDGELSWDTVRQRCREVLQEDRVHDPAMMHWEGVAMHFLGTLRPSDPASPTITLNNMWLEIDASRKRILRDFETEHLYEANWISFLSDRLPSLVRLAADDEVLGWQKLGLALIDWEWSVLSANALSRAGSVRQVHNRIRHELPVDLLRSIEKYPEAWPVNRMWFESEER